MGGARLEAATARLAEKVLRAMLMSATTRGAVHVRLTAAVSPTSIEHGRATPLGTAAVFEVWTESRWQELHRTDASLPVYLHLMQLIEARIDETTSSGGGQAGRLTIERTDKPPLYVLVAVAIAGELRRASYAEAVDERTAIFELVDEATYVSGRALRLPS